MVDIPVLIWSTGWSFLGASVMAYVAQLFSTYPLEQHVSGPPYPSVFYPTVHNTWVNPVSLSWNLGSGWFASAGFAVFVPDGSRYDNTANPDHWTYEPHAAVSYLANGWNLTANFVYDFNTASAGHVGDLPGRRRRRSVWAIDQAIRRFWISPLPKNSAIGRSARSRI